jgi:glycosyltransferase involved in cell wall biosynthesis
MHRDLVVFGEDWGALPSSTQHLVGHLGRVRGVLWVNSIGLRRPRLNRTDIARAWSKISRVTAAVQPPRTVAQQARFPVLNPLTLPVPRGRIERQAAGAALGWQVRRQMRRAGLSSPILWTSLPTAVDVVGRLDEAALVYYCGDDFSALAGVDHDLVSEREAELVERADLILAASDTLAARFPAARTQVLHHGVDYELFASPSARASDLPADGRPIAGFYGSLSQWLDVDLLAQVIKLLPQWHFVFIGKASIDTSTLSRYANVHLLGPRTHAELPAYSQHWSASMLPFKSNAQIEACNPLKLREYLAAGSPLVSTPFPALDRYRSLVRVAADAPRFADALQASRVDDERCARRASVCGQTWQAQASRVGEWLDAL